MPLENDATLKINGKKNPRRFGDKLSRQNLGACYRETAIQIALERQLTVAVLFGF